MSSDKKNIVNVFIPCHVDMYTPETAALTISILEKLGIECYYNSEQTCCGRQFYIRGDEDSARMLGKNLLTYFHNPYPIVSPSTACVGYIKKYYASLFENRALPEDIKHITHDIYELCDYIVNCKHIENLGNYFPYKVFYFSSCAARNLYGSGDEAQILLQNTEGLQLVTDPNMKICCSANGDFAVRNQEMSTYFLKMIVDKIKQYDVDYVTSTDVHCLQYIDAYLKSQDDASFDVTTIPVILGSFRREEAE